MANIKTPTTFRYNSDENKDKTIDQINTDIKNLIKIKKELRSQQDILLRRQGFIDKLEKFKHFI